MTKQQAEKGIELCREIEDIEKFLQIIDTKTQNRSLSHIKIVENYGNSAKSAELDCRHTYLFVDILKSIKLDLEKQLLEL